ncbi:MAG: hypothetical protein EBZ36_06580 [Acidobacteria bacterium]|nr:hypothetical protein [Acidobacteriota bacterium]
MTVTAADGSLPSGATFTAAGGSGEFNWTPVPGQAGSYTISFTATDNGTPVLSETRTVIITVVQPNRTPVLTVPAAQTVVAGQLLSFTVSATDPDAGQTLSLTATTSTGGLPAGAVFTPAAGSGQFRWMPTTAQVGNYTINFLVTDNGTPPQSSSGSVTVRVTPAFTTLNFTTATVSASGVVTRSAGRPTQQYEEDLGGGVRLEMVTVPGGSFTMGSPTSESGRNSFEGPPRVVNVGGFVMGKYEVTQGQWRAVMGSNPSYFTGDNLPVESVSWDEAQEFCRRLNARLGLSGSNGYRLPSEAEWEYAARAGTTTPFAFGATINSEIVNYHGGFPYGSGTVGLYREKTVDVGSLGVANGWGLYDMHGNVWEWCEDDWHDSYSGAPTNGSAWVDSSRAAGRVFRGGSWDSNAVNCRSADRDRDAPGLRYDALGFRLARTLP